MYNLKKFGSFYIGGKIVKLTKPSNKTAYRGALFPPEAVPDDSEFLIEQAYVQYFILVGATSTSGIISGLSNSMQSYLGGVSILELIRIDSRYADYVVGSYAALASLISYYAFFVQNSIDNAKSLSQLKLKDEKVDLEVKQLIWNITRTTFVSTFGAAALGAFSFFTVAALMEDLPEHIDDKIPEAVKEMIPTVALIATLFTTMLSRVAETYKYFVFEKALTLEGLSNRKKAGIVPGIVIGSLDIAVFMMTLYIACINTAKSYKLDKNPIIMQTFSVLAGLSGGFLHYIFSVRKILKVDMKVLIKSSLIKSSLKSVLIKSI